MSAVSTLAPDAAMVLGIASTAMPFARTPEGEAERWLRVLRLHGEVGVALQTIGVSEGPLGDLGESAARERTGPAGGGSHGARREGAEGEPTGSAGGGEGDAIAQVLEHAVEIAGRRGAVGVTTRDLVMAVMEVYGEDFDRVLRAHGTDRDELLERLGTRMA
ncbi:MAG TPA: hypothetical protein VNY52_00420 [Solirubrobacteraceae bacterium]|jgi:hypothetical protein|nr:hypothetical protein [Solirubrobacteraceae bacterium]